MGEAQELQLHIMDEEAKEVAKSPEYANVTQQSTTPQLKYNWWLQIALYTLFVLAGQSVATLLARLYYNKGGNSKWMIALMQISGFPILLPCLLFISSPPPKSPITKNQSPDLIVALIYIVLGLLLAGNGILCSIGLSYLPVSTFSLLCASQLAFTAFFSFFLNSQKFTPFIINSLVLLTISSTLLGFQADGSSKPSGISKAKYAVGFLCTFIGSAGSGLMLSLTQLAFRKVLKRQTFRTILDMIIYQSLVGTCAILAGLFASGEWMDLKREMEEFSLGKFSYVMTLSWIAISWQVFSIGAIGLIFQVSSVFCNVISTLGLPIIPVFAVIFFHDKMDGVKVMAMLLAIWGFVSHVYKHYLDEYCESKAENKNANEVSEDLPMKEVNQ